MRLILTMSALLILSACDSAPSEESPVAPAVVCEQSAEDGTCPEYDEVVDDEAIVDGNVISTPEEARNASVAAQ